MVKKESLWLGLATSPDLTRSVRTSVPGMGLD